jgi:hypothetical protein
VVTPGQRSKPELTELEMPLPFDHTLMSTAAVPSTYRRVNRSGLCERAASTQPGRTSRETISSPEGDCCTTRTAASLFTTDRPEDDDELDEPPVLTTLDWLTTTRAVLMDTGSDTRTSLPHPATTTVNAMRPAAPSQEADLTRSTIP